MYVDNGVIKVMQVAEAPDDPAGDARPEVSCSAYPPTTHHPLPTTHHPPPATYHPPFTIHHSPLTTHFAAAHPPPCRHAVISPSHSVCRARVPVRVRAVENMLELIAKL
jgi:hypothetical protein